MRLTFKRKILGALFLPLLAVGACSGLTDAEKAEYEDIKAEIARIQVEEIGARQERLHEILSDAGIDVEELQAEIARIRSEKLGPLEEELAALQSGDSVLFNAPGEPVDEEALRAKLEELQAALDEQTAKADAIRAQITNLRNNDVQGDIELRLRQIAEIHSQLDQLRRQTDERAQDIQDQIVELDVLRAGLDPDSEDYAAMTGAIESLTHEWDKLHADAAKNEKDLLAVIARLESEIKQLERSTTDVSDSLRSQLAAALKEIERSIHEMQQQQAEILTKLQPFLLGAAGDAPESDEHAEAAREERIAELEALIKDIVDNDLRPLIEKLNASVSPESKATLIEELKVEMKEWLALLSGLRERLAELTRKSFDSLLSGFDLQAIFGNLLPKS
jgi:chromosome segregation ATPase